MLTANNALESEQLITPDNINLSYSGRIDFTDPMVPCFIYAGSSIHFRFYGTCIKLIARNHRQYWNNYIGFIIDGNQDKIKLSNEDNISVYELAELPTAEHDVIIFKRQDSCHYFDFLGLILDKDAILLNAPGKPSRRIECFGDSVSAGEVSEAVEYVGKADPEHNGEYSNSWYSYAAITARRLGAELHNNSQGGIALLNGTGYFEAPGYVGLENTFDKLRYNSQLSSLSPWDFSRYTPHVVLVAIGQNDNHPKDYMGIDQAKSGYWQTVYKSLILKFREQYPNALIILKTTILNHRKAWDDAIRKVKDDINDPKIVHFLYSNNGCGTPGHIRIPEAEQMASELTSYINSFGDGIWL